MTVKSTEKSNSNSYAKTGMEQPKEIKRANFKKIGFFL